MAMEILPALPEPAAVLEAGVYPAHQHPVLAYLGRLGTPVSRDGMLRRLTRVARLLSGDTLDAMHVPWHQLTYVQLLAVRATLAETNAMQTTNTTLYAVKGVLKECWRLNLMTTEAYLRARDVPAVKGSHLPFGRALEGGELTQLVYSCRQDRRQVLGVRDAAVLGLLYGLGLRTSEAISLDRGDYAPTARSVQVVGKGNKARELPCPEMIAEVLQSWLDVRGLWAGPLITPVSVADRVQHRRLDRRSINTILRRRRERAGVAHFTPHDCRRTFISHLLDATHDLATVQALAGHSDPKITAMYDRRGMRAKQQAMGRLSFPG